MSKRPRLVGSSEYRAALLRHNQPTSYHECQSLLTLPQLSYQKYASAELPENDRQSGKTSLAWRGRSRSQLVLGSWTSDMCFVKLTRSKPTSGIKECQALMHALSQLLRCWVSSQIAGCSDGPNCCRFQAVTSCKRADYFKQQIKLCNGLSPSLGCQHSISRMSATSFLDVRWVFQLNAPIIFQKDLIMGVSNQSLINH